MISPTILKVLQDHLDLLHDPDDPRNLDFYLSLPEKPDKGASGLAVGSPLLLYGMVLLLTGQPEWKLLIAKSVPWFEVELSEGNEPGRLCSAIERMVSASWVTGTPCPLVPGEMLQWVRSIDVPGYETRLREVMLVALASGELGKRQIVTTFKAVASPETILLISQRNKAERPIVCRSRTGARLKKLRYERNAKG